MVFGPQYTVHHQSLLGSFTTATQYTMWPSRLKTLVMYYNSVGKAYFGGLRQFHVSWIGPQRGVIGIS